MRILRDRLTPLAALLALLLLLAAPHPACAVVDSRVDLNNAEAEDFARFGDTLEDVDVERILQARTDRGDFKRIEDVIDLIGLDKFTEIQDDIYVTVTRERTTGAKVSGSARFDVRAREWNDADPLIKSRTNYEDGPEYRKEFELSADDRFEGYMRMKRSTWLKTNSEYVYDRRASWKTWGAEKIEKRKRKVVRKVKSMSEFADATDEAALVGAESLSDGESPDGTAEGEALAAEDPGAPSEDGGPALTADAPDDDGDGASTEDDDEAEDDEATAEVRLAPAPPLHLVTELKVKRGRERETLLRDARFFSDGTSPVALELRFAAEPAGSGAATLENVETADGVARFTLTLERRRSAAPETARATAEAALAAPAPITSATDSLPAPAEAAGHATMATGGTLPAALEASTLAVTLPPAGTSAVALAPALSGTTELAASAPVATAPVTLAAPAATVPAESLTPLSASLSLERTSGGRAADELFHRTFALGTGETARSFSLAVRALAGESGPPAPLRLLRSRAKDGVVTLRVECVPPAPAPTPVAAEAAGGEEEDAVTSGDGDEAPKVAKAKKKKKAKKAGARKARKRKAKDDAAGLEFPPSRVKRVRETTVEVTLVDRKTLKSRLDLGNVTMAPVRKPLLGYTSTLYKRGVKYARYGEGWRDAILYANMTDENERLYGNHIEYDLGKRGVIGSQIYRIECATEGKEFTNLNLYAKTKFDETKLEAEFGRVPGCADAVYLKTDTRVKKLNVYTIFNAIEPRYDDESFAEPFSMTRFQEYTQAYLKALWKPDRKVSVTARKSIYAKGEVDGQNGESRNAADTWYFRYAVTDTLALRADLYRTLSTGQKEGNTLRLRAFWDAAKTLRLEASMKTYDYNDAAGSTSRKNAEHALYAAWRARPDLTLKAKGERENQDDRDVLTNTAGFEWRISKSHYLEFEAENERISGKLVPTVQIETAGKARYVYRF